MLRRFGSFTLLVLACAAVSPADTVELKDAASVTGRIVAEKPDQVFVDIGYTIVAIPRKEIVNVVKTDPIRQASVSSSTRKRTPRPGPRSTKPGSNTNLLTGSSGLGGTDLAEGFYRASAVGPRADRTVRDLVNQLGEAVVQVRTPSGQGSGFFINEEGYLITNFHVIEGETQISVEVYHQRSGQLERKLYKQVRIVALNKFDDLALLKIEDKDAPKFVSVPFGDSDALAVGDRVFAIGSPLGLERTVTEGIISTKTRLLQGRLYLQTTAQINPGNSGGPLFNLAGEVVGVTNMKAAYGEGLGFAIPANAVKFFLDHRDAYAYANDNPSNPYKYLDPPGKMRLGESNAQAGPE